MAETLTRAQFVQRFKARRSEIGKLDMNTLRANLKNLPPIVISQEPTGVEAHYEPLLEAYFEQYLLKALDVVYRI